MSSCFFFLSHNWVNIIIVQIYNASTFKIWLTLRLYLSSTVLHNLNTSLVYLNHLVNSSKWQYLICNVIYNALLLNYSHLTIPRLKYGLLTVSRCKQFIFLCIQTIDTRFMEDTHSLLWGHRASVCDPFTKWTSTILLFCHQRKKCLKSNLAGNTYMDRWAVNEMDTWSLQ